jgi:predicted MFS family arabinose efflux permease
MPTRPGIVRPSCRAHPGELRSQSDDWHTRRLRRPALVIAFGAIDFGLEQFMIVPILPAVQQSEQASLTATAWLLTGFLLAAVA